MANEEIQRPWRDGVACLWRMQYYPRQSVLGSQLWAGEPQTMEVLSSCAGVVGEREQAFGQPGLQDGWW